MRAPGGWSAASNVPALFPQGGGQGKAGAEGQGKQKENGESKEVGSAGTARGAGERV